MPIVSSNSSSADGSSSNEVETEPMPQQRTRKMLAPVINDVEESKGFVRRIAAIAISSIFYYRGFFDKEDYGDFEVEGKVYHLLATSSPRKEVGTLISQMCGIFEALDLKYLKTLVVGFYKELEDADSVVEAYYFRFKYEENGGSSMRIKRKRGGDDDEEADAALFEQTVNMNEQLKQVIRSLKVFKPDPDLYVRFKLYYYDSTPEDYNPSCEGFKLYKSPPDMRLLGEPGSSKCGGISTKFHQMAVKAIFDQSEVMDAE